MVSVQIATLAVVLSASGETALLDFCAPWCAPCRSMEGTVAQLEHAGYPVRKVNIDNERDLARQFGVKSVPCFVLVVDGREAGRVVGAVSRRELERLFARAGVRPGGGGRATTRAQSPDPAPGAVSQATFSNENPLAQAPPERREWSAPGAPAPAAPLSREELIGVSVRLNITDPQGVSHGSGTLIDARQGEALVLTCGHIFRDSQGKGDIAVDFCSPGGPRQIKGRLVSYDLESDVALVSIRPGVPVKFARVAPKSHHIQKGDPVMTVGCNNGGPATVEESRITAVNKFRAPPNVSVAGMPVQGRSGGGLFTTDGQVIGVCNAADPADHEGLYAALAAVQTELDEVGLSAIYENPQPGGMSDQALAQTASPPQPAASFARGGELLPSGSDARAATAATVAEMVDQADGAEVICIVRSLNHPDSKTKVIMLDRASPDFLRQLAADRQAQEARHLTSLRSEPRVAPPVVRKLR